MKFRYFVLCCLVVLLTVIVPLSSGAYSVLTHEALIDVNWEKYIKPLLKEKYPASTEQQFKEAHAYAYGGAVAPDMGYYPFGSKLFTNLVHYVRSGDFVESLLFEAHDLNEYAFALGALCHYSADKYGHKLGVNRSVPIAYPKMKQKFGDVVTYAENKISHIRTEFSFDVLQTARGNYVSTTYHDFIGFKVSTPVLERAFLRTYGLNIHAIFKNLPLAIETFRWTVTNVFPSITKVAWATNKKKIQEANPGITADMFRYRIKRDKYNKEFGEYKKPGIFASIFAVLFRILPKVGPLRALRFKAPSAETEKLFIKSFDSVLNYYSADLTKLNRGKISLPNIDFDTGNETAPAEYPLADKAYAALILKLEDKKFDSVSSSLKKNIITFYTDPVVTIRKKNKTRELRKINKALSELKKSTPDSPDL